MRKIFYGFLFLIVLCGCEKKDKQVICEEYETNRINPGFCVKHIKYKNHRYLILTQSSNFITECYPVHSMTHDPDCPCLQRNK